jgi:hypothetical protein
MVIATGARGYVSYDFETSYGAGAVFTGGSAAGKRFGMQEKINSWTLNNSRINLATLNQTELEGFAYGQETGSLGVGFVLSNPWLFGAIYGAPATTGSGVDRLHTYEAALGTNNTRDIRTFETQIGLDFPSGLITRKLKGCILRTFGISCNIGGTVDCTADIAYSVEDAPDASTALVAPSKPTTKFPYTFAHASLKLNNAVVAKIQSADISFNINPDMLYQIGSHQAVEAFRRVFEITGTFQASWVNATLLNHVLAQVQVPNAAAYEETIGGSAPELELDFTNGRTGDDERRIQITLEGVSPTEHSIAGIEPVEPVFESITWQAKSANIKAYNSESAEP